MSDIGDAVKSLTNTVTSLATTLPADTPFMRNARPFAIYLGVAGLCAIGLLATWLRDGITAGAVVLALGAVVREFGRFRSMDRQADISAAAQTPNATT